MLALIKKDLFLSLGTKNSLVFLIFFPFFFMIFGANSSEVLVHLTVFTITFMLSVTPFSYETLTNANLLILSLPIKRRTVVISKYILGIFNFGIALIYTYGFVLLANLLPIEPKLAFNLTIIQNSFLLSLVAIAFTLPFFYLLPPKIARVSYIVIFVVLLNIFVYESNDLGFEIASYPLTVGLIYLASLGLSSTIYKFKDLS